MRFSKLVQIARTIVLGAAGSCGGDKTATPPEPEMEILTVILSSGVSGNLTSGDSQYTRGEVVSYNFVASAGFENVRVEVADQRLPSSGTFIMDGPKTLVATADAVLPLSSEESSAVTALSVAIAQGNALQVATSLDLITDSLLQTIPDSAARVMARIVARAVVPERDAGLLVTALQASREAAQRAEGAALSSTVFGTEIIYVNGVLTTSQTAQLTAQGWLSPLARKIGLTPQAGFTVSAFHNTSATPTEVSGQQVLMCVALKWNEISLGLQTSLSSIDDCYPPSGTVSFFGGTPAGDFEESAQQIVNLVLARGNPLRVQQDARGLADRLVSSRAAGRRLILVSHSQGNLMVQEALRFLTTDSRWTTQDFQCVGWVGVAPPLAPVAVGPMTSPSSLIVRGAYWNDILLPVLSLLPNASSVATLANDLSNTYDGQGWFWSRNLIYRLIYGFGIGGALHSIGESYFGAAETSDRIGDYLEDQADALDLSCPSFPPHQLAVGASHTCAITLSSETWCWGSEQFAALGYVGADPASFLPARAPVRLTGNPQFTSVHTRGSHTCGITAGGLARCWGRDGGALGDGVTSIGGVPSAWRSGLVTVLGGPWLLVSGGRTFSCGLTTTRKTFCWGTGASGEIGDPSIPAGQTVLRPNALPSSPAFNLIAPGWSQVCGLASTGEAYCWGHGPNTGTGSQSPVRTPTKVQTSVRFSALYGGGTHMCGIDANAAAYCWGGNVSGQIGNGSTTDRLAPVAVAGGLKFSALTLGTIFAPGGGNHTCGISPLGVAYCWGENGRGQLGDGSTVNRSTPVPVSTTERFVAIGAGDLHTCAMTAARAVFCWGDNTRGQLTGANPGGFIPTPVRVPQPF